MKKRVPKVNKRNISPKLAKRKNLLDLETGPNRGGQLLAQGLT